MVRVRAHPQVESFLPRHFHQVLVGADPGRFERFRRQLLVLVRHHVHAQREFVHVRAFAAEVEDADFRVGHTAVEAGFGVGLQGGRREVSYIDRRGWKGGGYWSAEYCMVWEDDSDIVLLWVERGMGGSCSLTLFLQ